MSIKPLGSEKLDGIEKIQRILQISNFQNQSSNNINENKNYEYKITLADGNEYQIIKEKVGYIIKKTISESSTDYIEPMKNRKYYNSYSQALKRLNLMAKEMNTLYENEDGVSLFSEQKKFVLKTPNTEKKNPEPPTDVENVPPPPPPAESTPAPAPPPPGGEAPTPPPSEPPMGDMGGEELPSEDEMPPLGPEEGPGGGDKEEEVSFKIIQKLTGKLGQKLRSFNSGEEKMSSKDIKYVINSILSALDLNALEDEDREEILGKFEDMGEEGDMMGSEEDMGGGEELPAEDEMPSEEPTPEGGEMGEASDSPWVDFAHTLAVKNMSNSMTPALLKKGEMGEEEEEEDEDGQHIRRIADEMFVENKVEDILTKYFVVTENEKKFNSEIKKERKVFLSEKSKEVVKAIHRLSESKAQEEKALSFFEKNKNLNFVGRTNKKNLVFELGNKQFKVTSEGKLI